MLPHTPVGGRFEKPHARFTHADASVDWSALAGDGIDPRERERGRRSFVLRTLDEQRSLLAFSELLAELCEAGAGIDVIGSLTRVVRDEAAHVELCGRVVLALGGWPAAAPAPSWVRSDRRLPLRQRILRSVIGSLCIGETISVAMIAGVRQHAESPVAHEVLTRMLADESFHSRFGWWWLEEHRLTDGEHAWLERWLPRVLAAVERTARPSPEQLAGETERPHVHSPYGSMSFAEREDAFLRAIDETILPSFERQGIDARAAWQRRHAATEEK